MRLPRSNVSRWVLLERRRRRLLAKKLSLIVSGCALMVLGVLAVPLPLPIGFLLFMAGLFLVARASKRVRNAIRWLRRLVPPFSRSLNGVKHRLPEPLRALIERSDPGL